MCSTILYSWKLSPPTVFVEYLLHANHSKRVSSLSK